MQPTETKNLDDVPIALDLEEQLWFDTPPPSGVRRMSSAPPAPLEKVGEFLGEPDVDAWLR
jgi:hypothetical protein